MMKHGMLRNGEALPLESIPTLAFPDFQKVIKRSPDDGLRLICLCVAPDLEGYALLTHDDMDIQVVRTVFPETSFPSLTPHVPQANLFEREIAEQRGLRVDGHPWCKPLRFHHAWTGTRDAWGRDPHRPIAPCVTDFYRVEGDEIHEVAVGPVHAGVIEPGHFRFQCQGETVHHLEIALGYQHRGIERALLGGPHPLTLKMMETLAGDTTIGHAWSHCLAMEALAGVTVPIRAQLIRILALELERLANHTGDLGALAGDVGFLPTSSFCGRLRGDWLNLSATLCGSRMGRDLLIPGGVRFDLDPVRIADMRDSIEAFAKDTESAVGLLWKTPGILTRFEGIGHVDTHHARDLGLVGPAGRASGLDRDVRQHHPFSLYEDLNITPVLESTGDVAARAHVRTREIQTSVEILLWALDRLATISSGPIKAQDLPLASNTLAIGMVEGWRGEIFHMAITDAEGRFTFYKIVDPSFHNWSGLAFALRGEGISDFPLCNKSFNLSYCGFDL